MQHFNFIDYELRFVVIVIRIVEAHRLAGAGRGPEVFA